MFIARVKQECEGRVVLGTGTCMDLTVEKKEAVTEELHSAFAQNPGSACAVSRHCQHWLGSPNKALARCPRELPQQPLIAAVLVCVYFDNSHLSRRDLSSL